MTEDTDEKTQEELAKYCNITPDDVLNNSFHDQRKGHSNTHDSLVEFIAELQIYVTIVSRRTNFYNSILLTHHSLSLFAVGKYNLLSYDVRKFYKIAGNSKFRFQNIPIPKIEQCSN